MEENPQDRTKRLVEEARRKFIEHEKASRASGGDNKFSLRLKLRYAIPLGVVALVLYSYSFLYTKYRSGIIEHIKTRTADKYEGNPAILDQPMVHDPEHMMDDKKW